MLERNDLATQNEELQSQLKNEENLRILLNERNINLSREVEKSETCSICSFSTVIRSSINKDLLQDSMDDL